MLLLEGFHAFRAQVGDSLVGADDIIVVIVHEQTLFVAGGNLAENHVPQFLFRVVALHRDFAALGFLAGLFVLAAADAVFLDVNFLFHFVSPFDIPSM